MKFTRIVTFALIGVFSVGTLVTVAEVNKESVNRDFSIADITGDRTVLETVTIENVIKTDKNSFEKVYIKNEDVLFEKTQFDLQQGVGEEILTHKDLYRGMNIAQKLETDTALLAAKFNSYFPYASNEPFVELAKKDKSTNEVMKEKMILKDININQLIMSEVVLEINNNLYYCIAVGNTNGNSANDSIKIYKINQNTLQLQFIETIEVSLSDNYSNISNVLSDGENIYVIFFNDKEYKLASFNPLTKEEEVIDLVALAGGKGYINHFNMDEQSIFLQTEESLLIIDRESLQLINEEADFPSFIGDYDFVYAIDQIVKDENIYVLYGTSSQNKPSEQLIVAYNVGDGSIIYEGKLPSMVDRGTGIDYSFK